MTFLLARAVRVRLLAGLVAVTVGASLNGGAAAAAGGYRFQRVSEPVAGQPCSQVALAGINDRGDLVGTIECHGAGMFTTVKGRPKLINLPTGADRYSRGAGLASNGIAAGVTLRNGKYWRSWLRYPNGKLTKIADPKAVGGYTKVTAVNRNGDAVGGYVTDTTYWDTVPFVYEPSPTGGRYRTLHLGIPGASLVEVNGINDHGVICGSFRDSRNHEQGFLIRQGHVHVVNAPHSPAGNNNGTAVVAIANNGAYAAVTTGSDPPPASPFANYVHAASGWSTVTAPSSWGYDAFLVGLSASGSVVGGFISAGNDEDASFVGRPR